MDNLMIAFKMKNHCEKALPGWFKATGHIIWYVKMDFTRKARWVKDGHKTPNPMTPITWVWSCERAFELPSHMQR